MLEINGKSSYELTMANGSKREVKLDGIYNKDFNNEDIKLIIKNLYAEHYGAPAVPLFPELEPQKKELKNDQEQASSAEKDKSEEDVKEKEKREADAKKQKEAEANKQKEAEDKDKSEGLKSMSPVDQVQQSGSKSATKIQTTNTAQSANAQSANSQSGSAVQAQPKAPAQPPTAAQTSPAGTDKGKAGK